MSRRDNYMTHSLSGDFIIMLFLLAKLKMYSATAAVQCITLGSACFMGILYLYSGFVI